MMVAKKRGWTLSQVEGRKQTMRLYMRRDKAGSVIRIETNVDLKQAAQVVLALAAVIYYLSLVLR
jgi:hypothetical protein